MPVIPRAWLHGTLVITQPETRNTLGIHYNYVLLNLPPLLKTLWNIRMASIAVSLLIHLLAYGILPILETQCFKTRTNVQRTQC